MHNNINTFKYVRRKNQIVYKFHYPLPPISTTKTLHTFESKGDISF